MMLNDCLLSVLPNAHISKGRFTRKLNLVDEHSDATLMSNYVASGALHSRAVFLKTKEKSVCFSIANRLLEANEKKSLQVAASKLKGRIEPLKCPNVVFLFFFFLNVPPLIKTTPTFSLKVFYLENRLSKTLKPQDR